MTPLVLSILGEDRAGLVSTVSACVEEHGGSWEQSELARLAGVFAGIVLVAVPEGSVAALEADLAALQDLRVDVRRTQHPAPDSAARVALHLLGTDRPGIVAEISRAVASFGVGIDSMATEVRDAPMAGGTLFEVRAVLSAAAGTDLAAMQSALETIADELMVDLELSLPA
jgi:glycine cleavage system regulatory protein